VLTLTGSLVTDNQPETCPPGMKTGDPISPPGGYKGGGMQMLVDVSIDPAGNVWVSDNWQDPAAEDFHEVDARQSARHRHRAGDQLQIPSLG
jgi:hypothetical protein